MSKKYIGNAKAGNYDSIRVSVKVSELVANEKGYATFHVSPRKEADDYGNTHTVYILDGQGEQKPKAPADAAPAIYTQRAPAPKAAPRKQDNDELPF